MSGMTVIFNRKLGLHHLDCVTKPFPSRDFDIFVEDEGKKDLVLVVLEKNGERPNPALVSGLYGVKNCLPTIDEFLEHPEKFIDLAEYVRFRENHLIKVAS